LAYRELALFRVRSGTVAQPSDAPLAALASCRSSTSMQADPKHLQELLDSFRVDQLLSLVTLEEIAQAWCRYQTRPHIPGVEDEDPDWWAIELLMDSRFQSDEQRLRTTLDLLIERAPDDDVLGVAAAGPLEDFLSLPEENRLRWVEQRAVESDRFRQALQSVWVWNLPPDAFARIEQAAGAPLTRPDETAVVEVVPGDLPGTVHIKRNGETMDEIETEPDGVEAMINLMRRNIPSQEDPPSG
jgi:hypothetical protein